MLFFGFSSGLPFLLVAGTLSLWLKESGIVLADITMIASAGMMYVFKFLWAPLLDHWALPGFARLGRRRGWLLFAQLGVVLGLLAMAALTPAQLPLFIGAAVLVAFFGATQDIAVDAYLIEIAPLEARGALVATYSLGYRLALMLAAYNMGMGHVRDAQGLARRFGYNPLRWDGAMEVMVSLLEEPQVADEMRHGYAQGRSVVGYVERILTRYASYRRTLPPVIPTSVATG